MRSILLQLEELLMIISNIIWPIFIPFLLLMGAYICMQVSFNIKSLTTIKTKLNYKYVIPQASVALGAMMGTGTVIGFLSALSNLSDNGQIYVESVALWALIGSIVLIPISYCETLIAKVVNMSPRKYIGKFICKEASKIYVIALLFLYVFAIGGMQFSGIDAIAITVLDKAANVQLNDLQRYVYIVLPVIAIIAIIVFNNKEDVFIKSMISMILIAVVVYFVFFGMFVSNTLDYIPVFLERVITGFKNPVSILFGIPLGLIFGMQRVIQIAEPGLGTLALAAVKSDSSPRVSAAISGVLTTILVVVSILVTSYIASYGLNEGIISFTEGSTQRLVSYFETVISVTGGFGLVILTVFIILSGMTTLLGGYFLLTMSTQKGLKSNLAYLLLIIPAGALAVFNFSVLFNLLNILLFIATSLNILALCMFAEFEWSKYKIKEIDIRKIY